MKRALALALLSLLSACGKGDNAPGPGGVTVGEARALDEAAEMIEKRRLPDSALVPATAHADASEAGLAMASAPATTPAR